MTSVSRAAALVVVAVPTCRRPDDLARLLHELGPTIKAARDVFCDTTLEVLVIDNDPGQSAESVVAAAAIVDRYVVEPTSGVSAVRNRALREAQHADCLVFIDDDETPADEQWLTRLLEAYSASAAHVVAGPVRTVTAEPMDPWVVAGEFYARRHRLGLETGSPITRAATNNLLLDLDFVRESGVFFDERFGRTGGEDSLFTSELHRRGARMVWCAEALVLDHLPRERQTRSYALARSRGMASAGVRVKLALTPTRGGRTLVRVKSVGVGVVRWLVGGGGAAIGALVRSNRFHALGSRERERGIGSIQAAFGGRQMMYGG